MFAVEQVCNWKLFIVGPILKQIVKMHYCLSSMVNAQLV